MKMKSLLTAALLFWGMWASAVSKTIEDSRTYHKTFNVNADANFFLNSREAEVHISTWSQNTVDVKVTITVEAFDKEDLEKAFKAFQVSIIGSKENVTVKGLSKIKNYTSFGNKVRIRTDDDNFKIKNYSYHYEVRVPETNNLNVKNRFGKVFLGTHRAKVDLELYECNVMAKQIDAEEARFTIKFSKGELGKAANTVIEAYEGTVDMLAAEELNLSAKFSTFSLDEGRNAVIEAYESKVSLPDMNELSLSHSFGNLKMGTANKVKLKQYEQHFEALDINELLAESSKFSSIKAEHVKQVDLRDVYETRVELSQADDCSIAAKFSNIKIESLGKNYVLQGYETHTKIMRVLSNFNTIAINGKFMSNTITLNSKLTYSLSADLTFGTLDYPEGTIQETSYQKRSNGFSMSGTATAGAGTSKISLEGYEMKTTLNL